MKRETPASVESPCNGICQLSIADVCVGCGRTRYEIGRWGLMGDDSKRQVVKDAADRLVQMQRLEKASGFTLVEPLVVIAMIGISVMFCLMLQPV